MRSYESSKEGIMFNALYIKKCIKEQAQDELQYFRMSPKMGDENDFISAYPFPSPILGDIRKY